MIYQLDEDIVFPDPRHGEEDGLIAVGGDLSVERLLLAYSYGIFPWYSFRDWPYPAWYCPMQRFVIFPDEIHISHSMRALMNKHTHRVTFNQSFDGVIEGCSQVDGRYYQKGAWLGEDIIEAYRRLNRLGYATSVEVWDQEENLVGGLYGVVMGPVFIGERKDLAAVDDDAADFAREIPPAAVSSAAGLQRFFDRHIGHGPVPP